MVGFFIIAGLFIYFGYRIFKLNQEFEALKEQSKQNKNGKDTNDSNLFESDIPYYNGADSND